MSQILDLEEEPIKLNRYAFVSFDTSIKFKMTEIEYLELDSRIELTPEQVRATLLKDKFLKDTFDIWRHYARRIGIFRGGNYITLT